MDKVICVGKNYLEHAKELGDPVSEAPVFFMKPPSVVAQVHRSGEAIEILLPRDRGSVHHECEIVVRLDKKGSIDAVSLGLDMTLREVQARLKKSGHPWEISKVFKDSAVVGPWLQVADFSNYLGEEFSFLLDNTLRQKGRGKEMRLLPRDCVSHASQYFPLCEGDIIFTGTPAGVGPVLPGQTGEVRWGNHLFYRVHFK